MMHSRVRAGVLGGGGTAVLAAILLLSSAATPARGQPPGAPWHAGDPGISPITVSAQVIGALNARAADLFGRLDIHVATLQSVRERDNVRQMVEDRTVGLDANGKPVAEVAFDETGALRNLVNYRRPVDSANVSQPAAPQAAVRVLATVGLHASGQPQASWDSGMEAWAFQWPRHAAGYPVPTDALVVWILSDGGVRAISAMETPLQAVPALIVPADQVVAFTDHLLATRMGSPHVLGTPSLEWRQANNFADPALPDAPSPVAQLVWSIPFTVILSPDEQIAGAFWADAGSGELVGGTTIS
jgi:hypothetical protein